MARASPSSKRWPAWGWSSSRGEGHGGSAALRGGPAGGPCLHGEQAAALAASWAGGSPRFGVCLLHGVTGSGKTEVYLQAIARVVSAGKQAIVLVPEIALTPQTVGRFRARFREVAVLHSRLTEAQRRAQWDRIRSGKARVVVGARSASAPAPRLGLIVVDEEHDLLQAAVQAPLPRDGPRARLLGIPVVLGSASPSLEAIAWPGGGG